MYNNILVPVDGSQPAEDAVPVAATLASRDGANLRLLHVHQPAPIIDGLELPIQGQFRTAEREYVERLAARAASEFSVHVSGAAVEGDIGAEIVAEAERSSADLVVMTTHGRTGLRRAWLGSVADAVMRHVDIPVLMLRPADVLPPPLPIRCIVVPTDGSALSTGVVAHALRLGGLTKCRYVLARVVEPLAVPIGGGYEPSAIVEDQYATDDARQAAEFDVEQLAEDLRLDYPELDVRVRVTVASDVPNELLRIISEESANVVAIATHGRGVSRLAMGSVADKLLRGGSTAVLMWHAMRHAKRPASESEQESASLAR